MKCAGGARSVWTKWMIWMDNVCGGVYLVADVIHSYSSGKEGEQEIALGKTLLNMGFVEPQMSGRCLAGAIQIGRDETDEEQVHLTGQII